MNSNTSSNPKGVFTLDAKHCEAKVANLRKWSLTSLAQNRPTTKQQFCLREVKQQLAKFTTGCNISRVVDDVKFWLLRVALRYFAYSVNAS